MILIILTFSFSKNFLIEYLPPEQITSPQRAHELAVRFENHVASTTTTKVIMEVMSAGLFTLLSLFRNNIKA